MRNDSIQLNTELAKIAKQTWYGRNRYKINSMYT